MTKNEEMTPVQQFYAGESIFITGSTGFIGKVLLEKLLRSCADLDKVYVLVRGMERYHYLLESPIFNEIRNRDERVLSKIIPVVGNLSKVDLDISEDAIEAMTREVSVFFHCAASVRFDESPKEILETNLLGTKMVLDLFRKMKKRKGFVYLSTAYANSHVSEVDEEIYPTRISGNAAIRALEDMSVEELNSLAEECKDGRVNYYTLSKALTENYLKDNGQQLPITIIRPSIVTCSWKEPYAGWVDSSNAYTGVLRKISLGSIRTLRAVGHFIADTIPVDTVVNLLIVAPWDTYQRVSAKSALNGDEEQLSIYHCSSSDTNPLSWSRLLFSGVANASKYPSDRAIRVPRIYVTNNPLWHFWGGMLFHLVPALSKDVLLLLEGRRAKYVKGYVRYIPLLRLMEKFALRSWLFRSPNTEKLAKRLSSEDQTIFNFDVTELNWDEYQGDYVRGMRKYTYHEDIEDDEPGRKRTRSLRMEEIGFFFVCFALLCSLLSLTFRLCL